MRIALLVCAIGCADLRVPPTFPADAAEHPVVHEQALAGLNGQGDAAAVQLIDAEGNAPALTLLLLDHAGGQTRTLLTAPAETARAVSRRVQGVGRRPVAVLNAVLDWPEARAKAAQLGFLERAPDPGEPGRRRWSVKGVEANGALPLAIRVGEAGDDPRAVVATLTERPGGNGPAGEEIELSRIPVSGQTIRPELWIAGDTVWLQAGSTRGGGRDPLLRSVGLRRASLARAEAQLHNAHGLSDYGAGDLDAARREFDRAIAADSTYVDGLYNGAAAAALSDRTADAIALLRRAAVADPRRVQVLGRDDADFAQLRKRADVRALFGLKRPPPEDVPPPP